MEFYRLTVEETFAKLASSKLGLSSREVEDRKTKYGLNQIESEERLHLGLRVAQRPVAGCFDVHSPAGLFQGRRLKRR